MPLYKEELHHKTELSERLLKLREEHQLSKREMGAIAGKSLSSWHNYETGIIEPPVSVLRRICDHFGISMESLTGKADLSDEEQKSGGKTPKEKKPAKVWVRKKPEKVVLREESPEEREESAQGEEATQGEEPTQREEPTQGEEPTPEEEPLPIIVLQSLVGGSITAEEILRKVEAVAPQAEEIYVKTEDNRIYWTGGGESGSVEIWE